jgi:hypothetical protein
MPFPNQDYSKRDCQLPAGCKDLADAIKHEAASVSPPPAEPPITRYVTLPEKVSVKFMADISGQELSTIVDDLVRLRCFLGLNRSLDFEDAAKLLRKYGISATRAA